MQMLADLQQVAGACVGDRNNTGLWRQRLHPVGEAILGVLPVFWCRFDALINHTPVFLLRNQLTKSVLALCGPAFAARAGKPIESKALDAFFFQVQEGTFYQRVGCRWRCSGPADNGPARGRSRQRPTIGTSAPSRRRSISRSSKSAITPSPSHSLMLSMRARKSSSIKMSHSD
ncbi:Uncharacterised protein [Cedecea neteri]|uniref:Uncharacterized protein n=1 Tax=Cedecea neteri TaxID=158822 RepID=A0A2X2T0B1_9ENTR|nr:Uncharacterised protein [Cedecea neteri]